MCISMKRSYLKLHQVESETKSLGQVLEKASIHYRGTVLIQPIFVRMCISMTTRPNLKQGYVASKLDD